MTLIIVAIALCVLMEGLFSGAEIGFYSVNRLRLRSRVECDWPGAKVLLALLDQPDTTMMTTLIGTNVMVYAATALATEAASHWQHAELWATLIMTPVIFIFGEMIPKDLFHRKADSIMYRLAGPVDAFRLLMSPATVVLRGLVAVATGNLKAEGNRPVLSRAALTEWIAEGQREGVLSDYQLALSSNVMGLLGKETQAAMIPLEQVEMVPAEIAGAKLRDALCASSHSRLPVYSGPNKNIIGVLHALDYIRAGDQNVTAADLARDTVQVRPRDGVHAVLVALQRARQQMAVAVNRNGRPSGIVTVKDLVEEIVGELQDF
jgi:magnesium and cobalt exporter, CNNM family